MKYTFVFPGDLPRMLGTYPLEFGSGYSPGHLFVNMRSFPYTGKVVSWSYYVAKPSNTLFVGIYRSLGNLRLTLLERVQLPVHSTGYHNYTLPTPMKVRIGDFFGIHTILGSGTAISDCGLNSAYPTCKCIDVFQRYMRLRSNSRVEHNPVGSTVQMEDFIVIKTYSIIANIEP